MSSPPRARAPDASSNRIVEDRARVSRLSLSRAESPPLPPFFRAGYIRIKRTDDDDDVCATDDQPLVGVACALDENGDAIDVEPVEVCGTGAVLFDVSYPTGVYRMD